MTPAGEQPPTVRRARPEDVEAILDLLTHYDLPRGDFEPFYYDDPTYEVNQSWLVERGGNLAAHVRVFQREIRIDGHPLAIAGIGNVITAREERGQGHAARLLESMLSVLREEGVPYSLLWTHLPQVYARHGWVPVGEELIVGHSGSLPATSSVPATVAPFEPADLPQVMALYEETSTHRTGPFLRTPEYWRAQSVWLGETPQRFLICRDANGRLCGYVRIRDGQTGTEFLELVIRPADLEVGRLLLARAAQLNGNRLKGPLPPSLLALFSEDEREVMPDPGLMGRTVNLEALVKTLAPLLSSRVPEGSTTTLGLSTAGGSGTLRVTDCDAQLLTGQDAELLTEAAGPPVLNEEQLAELLFHGYRVAGPSMTANPAAPSSVSAAPVVPSSVSTEPIVPSSVSADVVPSSMTAGGESPDPSDNPRFEPHETPARGQGPDSENLRTLFPAQDFVIWTTDRF